METFAEYGAWRAELRHPQPDPAGRGGPGADSGTATTSRPSTTPRSTAPASTSGAPAPSTSTPPAAPTGPPPCGRTTGCARGTAPEPRPARLVPAALRAALLPQVAVARPVRGRRAEGGVPDQVRTGGRTAPGAGPDHRRGSPGRLRRRLRPEERRPAAGRPRGGAAPHRVPDPAAARRPAVCPAARSGIAAESEVGQEAAAAPPGRAVDPVVAAGARLPLRAEAGGALEGGGVPWRVSGHEVPVKAVVAKVEGYKKRFTLVTSAVGLTGLQMVELFCARFRQEDGFRDLKQRLGWEECRAWTRNPIERTSQAQWVTMSLLRLLQFRLDAEGCTDWWSPPPWNKKKDRPSVLDVERMLRRHRAEIQRFLSEWLGDEGEAA